MGYDIDNYDLDKVVQDDKDHVWHHLTQHKPFEEADPMVVVEGKGMRVWDAKGREFLDAVSGGVWTVNVGYGRERIANAVRDQLVKLCYFAGVQGNVPGAMFAEKLIEKMPAAQSASCHSPPTQLSETPRESTNGAPRAPLTIQVRVRPKTSARNGENR